MAKGLKCRVCGHYMSADKEKVEAYGTTVWYICRNTSCNKGYPWTEKVFEPK